MMPASVFRFVCRHAVGCEPYEVKPEGSNVPVQNW
jgi:hypothetical protein